MSVTSSLNPDKALIFRITHRDNLPWILEHGLHSRNSRVQDPDFVTIGNEDVIGKRVDRMVPDPPGGVLADYVPFYFTPLSPMLLNIKTGYHGVRQRKMEEIVILVSSLHRLQEHGLSFLFTDRHAIYRTASFYSELSDLDRVPWDLLRTRDFHEDPDEPGKIERYQSETLVYQHLPIDALKGIVCYNEAAKMAVDKEFENRKLKVKVFPGWFF